MKTMKDFAAQQLTKKQMNKVRGGKWCTMCELIHEETGHIYNYVTGCDATKGGSIDAAMRQTQGFRVGNCYSTYSEY